MNDKLLSLISLCKRAGFLVTGMDAVKAELELGTINLIGVASDTAENSLKKIKALSQEKKITMLVLPLTKDEIEYKLGSYNAVLAVKDKGMSREIIKKTQQTVNGG